MEPYSTWLQTLRQCQVVDEPQTPSYNLIKSFPHAIQTHGKCNSRSTPACKSQRPSKNSGHHPWVETQLPTQHQQICRGKLPNSVHPPQSTNFWWWKSNNYKLNRTHPLRVERQTIRAFAGTNITWTQQWTDHTTGPVHRRSPPRSGKQCVRTSNH